MVTITKVSKAHAFQKAGCLCLNIDRKTPVGNPYWMSDESKRDEVCDRFDKYFYVEILTNSEMQEYLQPAIDCISEGGSVALVCHCYPKRCHGLTIRNYIMFKAYCNSKGKHGALLGRYAVYKRKEVDDAE